MKSLPLANQLPLTPSTCFPTPFTTKQLTLLPPNKAAILCTNTTRTLASKWGDDSSNVSGSIPGCVNDSSNSVQSCWLFCFLKTKWLKLTSSNLYVNINGNEETKQNGYPLAVITNITSKATMALLSVMDHKAITYIYHFLLPLPIPLSPHPPPELQLLVVFTRKNEPKRHSWLVRALGYPAFGVDKVFY